MMQQESDEERKERIRLIREIKISHLLLNSKQHELKSEQNKSIELKNDIDEIKNKNISSIETNQKLKEEIENEKRLKEKLELENNKRNKEIEILYKELQVGVPMVIADGNEENEENGEEEELEFENLNS